jgi:hypothetical protein
MITKELGSERASKLFSFLLKMIDVNNPLNRPDAKKIISFLK